jgi:hypothetical protein
MLVTIRIMVKVRKSSGSERKGSGSENGAIVMLLRIITMGPFTSDCGAQTMCMAP